MSRTSKFFRDLAGSLFKSLTKSGTKPTSASNPSAPNRPAPHRPVPNRPAGPPRRPPAPPGGPGQRAGAAEVGAGGADTGRYGDTATVEVQPAEVGKVSMTYSPSVDGNPDPGEIVWTWVPFEENDGRGKDRPVLVVANLTNGSVLAVQLTSKAHDGDREFLSLGSGSWDAENRPSWVNLDRVFQVHPQGMRREAASLDKIRFDRVKTALISHYPWN